MTVEVTLTSRMHRLVAQTMLGAPYGSALSGTDAKVMTSTTVNTLGA